MSPRKIIQRVRGTQHGFIRRMVSPQDLGEQIKPFVFLDHLNGQVPEGFGFGFHPHSGIATLTYQLNADAAYEDTAGQKGTVKATGLEWMRAGGGTWHQGFIHPHEDVVAGFQLWLALPPGVEDGPAEGIYVPPPEVPQVGNVRVLLGDYAGQHNPIPPPSPVTYLDVVLAAEESFRFSPPAEQEVGWVYVYSGRATLNGERVSAELAVFEPGQGVIELRAETPCRSLIGSAKKHEHPLILGSSSVHTNQKSLAHGLATIAAVAAELRRDGRM